MRAAELKKRPAARRLWAAGRRSRATLLATSRCSYGVRVPLTSICALADPSMTPKNPVRAPLAAGLKVTATIQLAWGARLVPHEAAPRSRGVRSPVATHDTQRLRNRRVNRAYRFPSRATPDPAEPRRRVRQTVS
jgi:hypothetical protein